MFYPFGGLMTDIKITLSTDDNYSQHLCVTLASILANKADDDKIFAYILDGGISENNKSKILKLKNQYDFEIKFVTIDKKFHEKFPAGKKNHVTLATYYRLLLAEQCADVDKILYLDVDIVVKDSLKSFYNTNLDGKYFAGISDTEEKINASRLGIKEYCNAGVLLLNLKKWREDNITEKFFDWMAKNQNKIVLHDQDIINCVLQDGMLKVDRCWNVQVSKYDTSKDFVKLLPQAKIIHYIGKHKPWHTDCKQYTKNEYFKYLKLTDYKTFEKDYKIKLILKLPLLLLEDFAHKMFSIEKQGNVKYLILCGFKFKINNR